MKTFDLLVTDVGLPNGMNGRQLAHAISVNRPRINALLITGFPGVVIEGKGELLSSRTQMLTKPFSLTTFAAKVQSMVDKS